MPDKFRAPRENTSRRKTRSLSELEEEQELKELELLEHQHFIEDEADITKAIDLVPAEQKDLAEHYASIPGVSVSPDVKQFWDLQQQKYDSLDMKESKDAYLNAVKEMQQNRDALFDRMRDSQGQNNYARRLRDARESLKNAKQSLRNTKNEIGPFETVLFAMVGETDKYEKLKQAYAGVRKARRTINDIEDSIKLYQEKKDEFRVRIAMSERKMQTARDEIKAKLAKAKAIDDSSKEGAAKLEAQYKLIDQYQTIQQFKQQLTASGKKVAVYNALGRDSELVQNLENLPENLTADALVVSMEHPLTFDKFNINKEKIEQVHKEIEDLKGKLPPEAQKNLQDGMDIAKLKADYLTVDGQNITEVTTVEAAKGLVDKIKQKEAKGNLSPDDAERFKKQREFLELKAKDLECVAKINEKLQDFDPSDPQKVAELQGLKDAHQMLQEQLQASEYQQILNTIDSIEQKQQEEKDLRQDAMAGQALASIPDVYKGLSESNVVYMSGQTIGLKIQEIIDKIDEKRKEALEEKKNKRAREQGKEPEGLPEPKQGDDEQEHDEHDDQGDDEQGDER